MEVDVGDGPAVVLSENFDEVMHKLSEYFINNNDAAMAVRIAEIFRTTLRPAQLAGYVRLPAANTEEGVTINVFSAGDLFYSEQDTLRFSLRIRPGEETFYCVEDNTDDILFEGTTNSVFPSEQPVPDHWLEYRQNKLRMYRVMVPDVPMEDHGGDGWAAAFVDLCA